MLETVLPPIQFMKQGKSCGSDYELGGIHSVFREIRYSDRKKWLYKKSNYP